jgi:long-chain fatty acid transport protein
LITPSELCKISCNLKITTCFILLLALGGMVQRVGAGGFEGPGLGSRATAMGGAFIGVADDWTALYWNPAGLAQLQGTGVGTSIEYLHAKAHDSDGLANAVPPLSQANILRGDAFVQLGNEPARFNGLDSSFGVPLPAVGFYTHAAGFVLAAGSYAPLGFSFEVADHSQPGYDVSFKSRGYVLNHNVSVAREIIKGVRLGAGLTVVQAHLERFASKVAPTETLASSSKADGLGLQGVFGILADLGSRVRAGAVYRTGQDLNMTGHLSLSDSLFPLPIPGVGTFSNESQDFSQHLRNPTTYGVGVSCQALPSVTLAADWQRTEWNATRVDIHFDRPDLLLQNQNLDAGWTSTSRYRFGIEWAASSRWSFRGGYFRDPRAVSNPSEALTQLIDADLQYVTFGASYRMAHWRWTVGEQLASGRESVGTRDIRKEASSTSLQGEYFF